MASNEFGAARTIADLREIQREANLAARALQAVASIGRSGPSLSAAGMGGGAIGAAGAHAVLTVPGLGPEVLASPKEHYYRLGTGKSVLVGGSSINAIPEHEVRPRITPHSEKFSGGKGILKAIKQSSIPIAFAAESAAAGDVSGVAFGLSQALSKNRGALSKIGRVAGSAGRLAGGGFIGFHANEAARDAIQEGKPGTAVGAAVASVVGGFLIGGPVGAVAAAVAFTGKAIYDVATGRDQAEFEERVKTVQEQLEVMENVLGTGAVTGYDGGGGRGEVREKFVNAHRNRSAVRIQNEADKRGLKEEQVSKFLQATAEDAIRANHEARLGNVVSAYEIEQRMTSRGDVYLGKTGAQFARRVFEHGGNPGEKFFRWDNAKVEAAEYSRITSPRAGYRSEVD